jgi:hypothetical protein
LHGILNRIIAASGSATHTPFGKRRTGGCSRTVRRDGQPPATSDAQLNT